MNITARAQGVELSDAIVAFARDEMRASLERLSESVVSIDVFIKDANGPKGGVDKQVLIRVRLPNRHLIAVETAHENLYAAIRKGVKRTKRAVRRHLRKSRRIDRHRLRDLHDDSRLPTVTRA